MDTRLFKGWSLFSALALFCGALAAVFAASRFGDALLGFAPPCPLHEFLGLYCPGCGMTRGLLKLARFDFAGAAKANFFAFCVAPPFLLYVFWRDWTGRPLEGRPALLLLYVFLGLALAFALLRNLPFAPFSAFAPH